jgi:RNA polymerase sigma-70 factor (ECF subfamily)
VYRIIGDLTEAEDIAQNVFIHAYRSAKNYKVKAKLSTWLFTIARNLCLNEIRRKSRHPAESLDQITEDKEEHFGRDIPDKNSSIAEELILRMELETLVKAALDDLPENQRTAIVLYQEQGLSYEEISKILGCSLSATKSLIHRGREILKARLKPYLKTGHWETTERIKKLSKKSGF